MGSHRVGPLAGSYKQPKEQLFSSTSPEVTEKSIFPTGQSQAFSGAYSPGIKSNEAVEAKRPSPKRIRYRHGRGTALEQKSQVCFLSESDEDVFRVGGQGKLKQGF